MKRFFLILLISYFSLVCVLFAEEKFPFVGEVTANILNVRAGYNINYEIIHKINKEDKIVVLDRNIDWYKIKLPAKADSFISKKYITQEKGLGAEATADNVNVRARASFNSSIICQVNKGDKIKVVESIDDEWLQIEPPENCFGWVSDKYIKYYSTIEQYNQEKEEAAKKEIALEAKKKQEASEKKEAVKAIETQSSFDFEQEGVIKRYVSFFSRPGSHTLMQNGKIICYLKGDTDKLNRFINVKVKISGDIEKSSRYKYPVVIVKEISIVE